MALKDLKNLDKLLVALEWGRDTNFPYSGFDWEHCCWGIYCAYYKTRKFREWNKGITEEFGMVCGDGYRSMFTSLRSLSEQIDFVKDLISKQGEINMASQVTVSAVFTPNPPPYTPLGELEEGKWYHVGSLTLGECYFRRFGDKYLRYKEGVFTLEPKAAYPIGCLCDEVKDGVLGFTVRV